MQIQSSKDIKVTKVNSLSVGDSGKGKTHFVGTICDYGKPFVIDAEGGLMTIMGRQFDYTTVNTFKEFQDACAWYVTNYKQHGYTHLVIDSISRVQNHLVFSLSKDGKLTQQQWGEVLATLRKIIEWLTKECPTSIHVTSMAAESKDELTGMVKVYPNIQGSMKYDLDGYFDVVLYHDAKDEQGKSIYYVHTHGDNRIIAKNRAQSFAPMKKYEANSYEIVARILKGGTSESKS